MNRNSLIIIGSTIVLVGLVGFFLIKPNISATWQTLKAIQDSKEKLTEATKKETVLVALSKNTQINTIYDIAAKYIPSTQSSGELVIELSAMANQNNLRVEQFSLDTPTTTKTTTTDDSSADSSNTDTTKNSSTTTTTANPTGIKELKFSLKLNGNFSDFLNFIKSTETSSRLISFSNMDLAQATEGFTAQIEGIAYYNPANITNNSLENIEITKSTIQKFQNLKSYGTPIDLPTESGFGRTNPFDTIQ